MNGPNLYYSRKGDVEELGIVLEKSIGFSAPIEYISCFKYSMPSYLSHAHVPYSPQGLCISSALILSDESDEVTKYTSGQWSMAEYKQDFFFLESRSFLSFFMCKSIVLRTFLPLHFMSVRGRAFSPTLNNTTQHFIHCFSMASKDRNFEIRTRAWPQ